MMAVGRPACDIRVPIRGTAMPSVRVDYRLTNRLRAGNPGRYGAAPTAFLDRGDPAT
jgi:hypothetical protein